MQSWSHRSRLAAPGADRGADPPAGAKAHLTSATLRVGLALFLGFAWVSLTTSEARAQDLTDQAAREFQEGQRAFGAGDFRRAAEQFEAAYKHKPHHAPLYNAARARMRAGDSARAANLYVRYLREAPADARDRSTAAGSLRQLATKLGHLEVHAVGLDDLKLDEEPATEGEVYVSPGAHVVEARKGETAVRKSVSVDAGQTVSVALVAATSNGTSTATVIPPSPPRPKPSEGWSPVVVVVGGGVTVVGLALTIISGVDAAAQKRALLPLVAEADRDPGNVAKYRAAQSSLDLGTTKAVRTNVLLITTLGVGVLTGVAAIWLVDWHEGDRTTRVGVGPGELIVRGSF